MKMISKLAGGAAAAALALGAGAVATPAFATPGFIALEGSDATTFHHDGVYTPQLFKYLQGGSSKDVLVYAPGGGPAPGPTGGVGTMTVSSLTGVTLTDFSALYVETPGGCCTANNTVLNGFGASVNSFISGGGNLSIENYTGGSYDGTVPGGAGSDGTNVSPSYFCSDGETVTAAGISKGFGQPAVDGCWSHQAYSNAYWVGKFGYLDLIHADPTEVPDGSGNGSSFLALGGTLGAGVPEPATWAMMLLGFGGLGAMARSRRKQALATA